MDKKKVLVYIGIGSNIGDRKKNIKSAIVLLKKLKGVKLLKVSRIHETVPVGPSQRNFFNSCAKIETVLSPAELLKDLKTAEKSLGRKKTVKWGPRVIDLDILFYGNRIIRIKGLIVPHVELHKRKFVLVPLNEICPAKVHPVLKKTVNCLLKKQIKTKGVGNGKTYAVVSR